MAARVLIAGGGVAALEAALALHALAEDCVDVELLAPEPHFWYRPLAVTEPFGLGEVQRFALPELAASAGASFTRGALTGVDIGGRLAFTAEGAAVSYDVLLIACGAIATPAIPGALTFTGRAGIDQTRQLLEDVATGEVRRIAFCVPWGTVWSLPLYELALMTAAFVEERELNAELLLVTPEEEPLQIFGRAGSDALHDLLEERNVRIETGSYPIELVDNELRLLPAGTIHTDRVLALPRLRGIPIDGISQRVDGFIRVDEHGQVTQSEVLAAGDITTFPVKQGGIATQQADAAAELIASQVGADITPQPFRPVLRGLLLTGRGPRYLMHDLSGGSGDPSWASPEPLWWPPAKIVGHYLAPFLASIVGGEVPTQARAPSGAVSIEVELDPATIDRLASFSAELEPGTGEDEPVVAEVMSTELLVVAPEDTLGEVAESMRTTEPGPALVCDFGRLVGVLTSRDLLRAFAGRVHPSEARVREWMTAEPVTVSRHTPIATAVTVMTEYGLHNLPVVEDERPVGLVGLRKAVRHLPGRTGIGLGF